MAFREVHVIRAKEVLRLWIQGETLRRIARMGLMDRKTARNGPSPQAKPHGPRTASSPPYAQEYT